MSLGTDCRALALAIAGIVSVVAGCSDADSSTTASVPPASSVVTSAPARASTAEDASESTDCEPYTGDNPSLENARSEVNSLIQNAPANVYFAITDWTVGHPWDDAYSALPDGAVSRVSKRICEREASPKFMDMSAQYPNWYPDSMLALSITESMACAEEWKQGRSSDDDLALCPNI